MKQPFDYERAMELAMYYLGFDENIFYSLCWDNPIEAKNYDVHDYFLVHPRKEIRDIEKTKYWLEKASILAEGIPEAYPFDYLILSCRAEGIFKSDDFKDIKNIISNKESYRKINCEKDKLLVYKKRIKDLEEKLRGNPSEKDIRLYKYMKSIIEYDFVEERLDEKYIENNYAFGVNPIIAYSYYRGIGLEKDLKETKKYLYLLPENVWRIFWVGWLVPRDQEFAKYILKLHNTPYSKAQLKRIESGFYDEID